eukprot:3506975-Pyramimonas_sp.AAC.1
MIAVMFQRRLPPSLVVFRLVFDASRRFLDGPGGPQGPLQRLDMTSRAPKDPPRAAREGPQQTF